MANYDLVRVNRLLAIWLFFVASMVFIMIVLGGVTRLTHSGLSIVEWKPFTGWLPPMSSNDWGETFSSYKQYPEFKEINLEISLEEFKTIFWFEFIHRIWGRLIGLALFLPLLLFLCKGWIKKKLAIHLLFLLILGGLQGSLGWFMVKSGLVNEPDVSQYRLAAHLCLAFVIFGYLIWTVLSLIKTEEYPVPKLISLGTKILTIIVFITVFSGSLVAGLDAGLVYNTFPLMDGQLVPSGLTILSPLYLNFFENILTVQFDHRILASVCLVLIIGFWKCSRSKKLKNEQNLALDCLLAMSFLQFILGIFTVLHRVPVWLGAFHQSGAVLLFGVSIWVAFAFRNSILVQDQSILKHRSS